MQNREQNIHELRCQVHPGEVKIGIFNIREMNLVASYCSCLEDFSWEKSIETLLEIENEERIIAIFGVWS